MLHPNIPTLLTGLLVSLALTLPLGCGDDVGEDEIHKGNDEVGDEHPPEVCKSSCQDCAELMKDAYACMAFDESEQALADFSCIVCDNDGPGSAAITCGTQANLQSILYTTMDAQLVACDNESMMAAKCVGWHPDSQVHPTRANAWDVERDLIADLVADPSRLIGCDDARVKRFGGSYRVTSVDSDDLLGRLGFMNDDVIQTINGYPMSGPFDVARAFFGLWPSTTVFTVELLRPGVGGLTFTFNLV